jgi:TonB family protein
MTLRPMAMTLVLVAGLAPGVARAQSSLESARSLYASAEYEAALAVLDALRAGSASADELRLIDEYRAFSLIALGRTADAEQAFEAIVLAAPAHVLPPSDASPRVRAVFTGVRRRVLPEVVRQEYVAAKAAFAEGDYVRAAEIFRQLGDLLDDPELGAGEEVTMIGEYRTLVAEYRQLALAMVAPPKREPAPEVVAILTAAPIFDSTASDVVGPLAIAQSLPRLPARATGARGGMLEVVIDEAGRVESAVMLTPVHPAYDPLALAAANTWTYEPALRDGVPVKYRKIVQISVKP